MVGFNHFLTAALAFASASFALALPTNNNTTLATHFTCGTGTPPLPNMATYPEESRIVVNVTKSLVDEPWIIVNVYWNVIYRDESFEGGYLNLAQVNLAMLALNQHFAPAQITFQRANLRYIKNEVWWAQADDEAGKQYATTMKNWLHTGTAKDLNIYSVGFLRSNLLGYSTFPWWYTDAPSHDGVVFKWSTVPGGGDPNYNQGRNLVHEVGHWAGLLHTFEGGCASPSGGDFVYDTPPEAYPAYGCPYGRDTCPEWPDNDPIHNIMDYTDDWCKTDPFTPGQIGRMRWFMYNNRNY